MTIENFSAFGLADPIQAALTARQHTTPTPIQQRAIPELLAGKDVLGIAQTGTGKTGAFALPILHELCVDPPRGRRREPRALILAPTRELAIQIGEEFRAYGRELNVRHTVIFGGVGQHAQVNALRRGVDILVATPGRLLDLMEQGHVRLRGVSAFVLDEADRMLDMGFVKDVRKIAAELPLKRQSLLFSATMPREIADLAGELLREPVRVEVAPQSTPVELIEQSVQFVPIASYKITLLAELLADPALSRVMVFTRTKHRANRIADQLIKRGISADAIHGNKSQNARQAALQRFRRGEARVLVATDIAARGLDIDKVSHVINLELPLEPESYVHRIGRTARAGEAGVAIAFCDPAERPLLKQIERLIGQQLTVVGEAPEWSEEKTKPQSKSKSKSKAKKKTVAKTKAKPNRKPKQAAVASEPAPQTAQSQTMEQPKPAQPKRKRPQGAQRSHNTDRPQGAQQTKRAKRGGNAPIRRARPAA